MLMLIKLQSNTILLKTSIWFDLKAIQKLYNLIKFRKTNQGTCINLKPIVKKGDRVEKGQVFLKDMLLKMGSLL